jgi:predicted dehydrogenase
MHASESPLRIGVIGFGQRGQEYAKHLRKRHDARIVAIVDPDKERQALASSLGFQAFGHIEELSAAALDGVLVCTPPSVRVPPVTWALTHHVPAMCEKPLALSLDEAVKITELCAAHSQHLIVGYTLRYKSPFREMQGLLERGALGDLVTVWLCKTEMFPSERWRTINASKHWRASAETGGGRHIERSHQLDWMLWVGGEPEDVNGSIATVSPESNVDDVYTARIRFRSGIGQITVALTPVTGDFVSAGIVGSRGAVTFDGRELCRTGSAIADMGPAYTGDFTDECLRFFREGGIPTSNQMSALQTLRASLTIAGLRN